MKATVSVELSLPHSLETIWALVGPFETMQTWFPGIIDIRIEGTGIGTIRHLTMSDGAIFSDQLTQQSNHQYSYTIVAGEVPFENYLGTVSVIGDNGSSLLKYHATIDVSEENHEPSVAFLSELYTNAFGNVKGMLAKT
ncbi:MAG: hypothetical protein COB26_05435 [Piscirickettsiaceae bacterium]|nr:MAG: hypothetical protein COB89_03420 [Piscirickettsiaceae bacterium]PCI69985.1 MAG: hypothetical protein COB26_05435 [Piscirickettsiaceae bacterium]